MIALRLLRLTAVFEGATGLALLAAPALASALLFGQTLDAPLFLLLVRLFGAPLLSLGYVCWAAGAGASGGFVLKTVAALLLYNGIVAALLAYSGAVLGFSGVLLWPAVIAHILLAGWCVAELTRSSQHIRRDGRAWR